MAKAAIKPPTKSQILTEMAESTGLAKKDVAAVLDALTAQIAGQMGKMDLASSRFPVFAKWFVSTNPQPRSVRFVTLRPVKWFGLHRSQLVESSRFDR